MKAALDGVLRTLLSGGLALLNATGVQDQFVTTDFPPGPRPPARG
ncbi:MAG: hypothetical protein RLY86_4149 [Pseudomonadota bacterium]|jgi:hypothetical protein